MKTERKWSFALFYQRYGVIALLFAIFIVAALMSPSFLSVNNLTNVLRQITVPVIIGCGACFVLMSANINIAYDGLISCVGTISCMIMAKTQNLALSFILGIVLGAIIGYLYGLFVTRFQIPGFIVGLAFSSIAGGGILLLTKGVAVAKTTLGNYKVLGQGYIFGVIPICVVIMLLVLVVCHVLLTRTCFGMKVKAIGGNKEAALASGINVNRTVRLVYLLDGITCAVGAMLFMSRINSGDPAAGAGTCFAAITAACVGGVSIQGGTGGIIGTLIGGAVVGILNNLLNLLNINANWQDIVSGIVILFAVSADVFVKKAISNKKK